jgi:hypothetical protein
MILFLPLFVFLCVLLNLFTSTLHYSVHVYLAIYVALLLATSLLYRLGLECVLKLTYNAAVTLHSRMLSVVLAAKPSFFDMTPTGRIMNRYPYTAIIPSYSSPFFLFVWKIIFFVLLPDFRRISGQSTKS